MEDGEIVLCPVLLQAVVVILQEPIVQVVELGVAVVELEFAQFWVVEEETAAEVIDSLLGLWQELVGDEGDVVARLAEYLREEWIVAPFSLLAHHMGGEHVLEYETGEIPAGYHVAKLGELAGLFQCHLAWGGLHEVAILLGVMATKALADNQYDVRRTIAATIHLDTVGGTDELGNLVCRQLVGVDAEVKSIDRQIEHGMVFLRQGMLHLADGLARHQLVERRLVVPRGAKSGNEQCQTENAKASWHGCRHTRNRHDALLDGGKLQAGYEEYVYLDELATEDGDEHLDECQQQYPAHTAEDDLGRDEAERKLLASELLVSPTNINMEGLSVEPKFTKQ